MNICKSKYPHWIKVPKGFKACTKIHLISLKDVGVQLGNIVFIGNFVRNNPGGK